MTKEPEESSAESRNFTAQVQQHSLELRKNPKFDPRKEKELDDIYNQYIPPHSVEETGHLLDVAERDAYIDPFPPIGSQKMAGAVIKKGVRVAIGWYIQYIAQQISTFGSGVAQALRSLHKDVDKLKAKVEAGDVAAYLNSLDLDVVDEKDYPTIASAITQSSDPVLVSDGLPQSFFDTSTSSRHIVVDPRIDFCSTLNASIDTRIDEYVNHIAGIEDSSVGCVVLHGRISILDVSTRIAAIKNSARILSPGSALVLIYSTQSSGALAVATELTGSPLWSRDAWTHVLEASFEKVETTALNDTIFMAVARNTTLSA